MRTLCYVDTIALEIMPRIKKPPRTFKVLGGAMDITAGTLIVSGDATSTISGYISNGLLTAFGGNGTLAVDYNITNPGLF